MHSLFNRFNRFALIMATFIPLLIVVQCSLLERGTVSLTVGNTSRFSMGVKENNIQFDKAMIGISKIEFKQLNPGEEEDDIDFEDDYVCDLIDESCDPDLGTTEIPADCYTKIEAELMPTAEIIHEECPEVENCVLVTGTAPNGKPFVLCYAQSEDFKAEDEEGFPVEAVSLNNVLLLFDLEGWFEGVPWDEVEDPDEDGVFEINKDANRDIHDIIEANIESNSELGRDQDEDGIIDEENCVDSE